MLSSIQYNNLIPSRFYHIKWQSSRHVKWQSSRHKYREAVIKIVNIQNLITSYQVNLIWNNGFDPETFETHQSDLVIVTYIFLMYCDITEVSENEGLFLAL